MCGREFLFSDEEPAAALDASTLRDAVLTAWRVLAEGAWWRVLAEGALGGC